MIKKGVSLALSMCMLMQIRPALAKDLQTENLSETTHKYIVNDQFESGVDGWIAGEVVSGVDGVQPAKLSQVASYTDKNGVTAEGVMKIEFDGTGNQYVLGQMQTAFREFETPYTYKEGVDVVIKTRILQTGEVSGVQNSEPRISFRHNRPNSCVNTDLENAENYWEHYMLFDAEQHGTNGSGIFYPNGVSNDTVNKGEILRQPGKDGINNYWMDVEMVISGLENTMTLTVTKNGETATADADITQPVKVYRKKYGSGTEKTVFDALESLTIQQRRGTNTVYVDYVEVYEEKIEADIRVNPTYKSGEPIIVNIDTRVGTEDFKNAFALYDVDGNYIETVNAVDSTKKIVTMNPEMPLTNGETYIVKVLKDVLSGYEFKTTEKYIKISACILDDTFDYGTDGWIPGEVADGFSKATITNQESYTDKNGVKADGVMKIVFDGNGNQYALGQMQTAFRDFGTPYEYKEDADIVIKTRILQTGEANGVSASQPRFSFRHNRPNSVSNTDMENAENYYEHYMLFDAEQHGTDGNGVFYPNGLSGDQIKKGDMLRHKDKTSMNNYWLDVEMVINGLENTMMLTVTKNGETDIAEANITQPVKVYRKKYGSNTEKTAFDALESLTIQQRRDVNTIYVDYVQVSELKKPVIENLEISGNVFNGEVITANYDYVHEEKEGNSIYEWFVSDDENGPWTKLEGEYGKTLKICEELSEKYVRFEVTPISDTGISGKTYQSNILAYEKAPMASDLRIKPSDAYIGVVTNALYEYSDINGDAEGNTLIEWQVEENGEWTKIGEGKAITLSENEEGKFLRFIVTPVSVSEFCAEGNVVVSDTYGPIKNIQDATNIFENTEFEDKTNKWEQSVNLDAGNRYIISGMVKKADDIEDVTEIGVYISEGNEIIEEKRYRIESSEEWTSVVLIADIDKSGEYTIGFMSLAENGEEFFVDNMYCGKLMISDIETVAPESIEIPEQGTAKTPIVTGRIFNQLGTTDGLEDEESVLDVNKNGVSVDGGGIIVDSSAVTGKFEIKISCTPSYPADVKEEYLKIIEIELTAPENNAPRVSNVAIEGSVEVGKTLYGKYDFYQVEGKKDASEFMWLFSDAADGDYDVIPDAIENKFIVSEEYKDKFIKFVVIPKTADGLVGEERISDEIIPKLPPVAKNITVTGEFKIGGEIVGSYTYFDINDDAENGAIYKWYMSDSETGEYKEIIGENSKNLVLTEEMAGKYLKFSVTPISSEYPEMGMETFSSQFSGPVPPYITELSIERKNNNILYAKYKYHHEYNAIQSGTLYKWTVDGKVVSDEATYVIDFTGNKEVTLTVTPGGDTNPKFGTPVSVSAKINGKTKTSGGGSGGSGGGSGGVAVINKTDITENVIKEIPMNDLVGHWGADAIKSMVMLGVMSADENGKYNPDEIVTREEMVTYLFKALKLEKSEYTDKFEDVVDSEFAKMLQTMVNNGTISKDIKFRPNDGISRQEYCKILYVSLKNAGKLKSVEEGILKDFYDYDDISDWAVEYVNSIYGQKIMIGVSEKTFAPRGNITKAQVATVLERMLELIEE